ASVPPCDVPQSMSRSGLRGRLASHPILKDTVYMPRRKLPILARVKSFTADARRDLDTTLTYLRLTLKGNRGERLTDFTRCEHPVLLLYGFGGTRRVFSILERRLRKDGFGVFSFNLGGLFDTFNTRSIEDMAQLVHEKVERLCQKYHLNKISIIGHS